MKGDDDKLVGDLKRMHDIHVDLTTLYAQRSVPPEMYTLLGGNPNYGSPATTGFTGTVGVLPAQVVRTMLRQCNASVPQHRSCPKDRLFGSYLERVDRNKKVPDKKYRASVADEWVWLFPLSIAPGIQTGWLLTTVSGLRYTSILHTARLRSLPVPTRMFFQIPPKVEYAYTCTDLMECSAMAGLYGGRNTLLSVGIDELNFHGS